MELGSICSFKHCEIHLLFHVLIVNSFSASYCNIPLDECTTFHCILVHFVHHFDIWISFGAITYNCAICTHVLLGTEYCTYLLCLNLWISLEAICTSDSEYCWVIGKNVSSKGLNQFTLLTSSVQEFQVLHTLCSICYVFPFFALLEACDSISFWF